jgi:hypothetical protein
LEISAPPLTKYELAGLTTLKYIPDDGQVFPLVLDDRGMNYQYLHFFTGGEVESIHFSTFPPSKIGKKFIKNIKENFFYE